MTRPTTADSMYTYENGVLKNKFNIKNYEDLDKKEEEIINDKLKSAVLKEFSLTSLLNLHKYLFEDLYEFAGNLRDENVVLDGVMLCQHPVIELCLKDLTKTFDTVIINSKEDMATSLAYYYSELLVIFPFRDGNEITIQVFLEKFTESKGYKIIFKDIDASTLKEAVNHAFYYDISKLKELFLDNIKN